VEGRGEEEEEGGRGVPYGGKSASQR